MPDEYNKNDGSFISDGSSGNDGSGDDKKKLEGSLAGKIKEIASNTDGEPDRETETPKPEIDIEGLIAGTNSKVLLTVLSPEVQENEDRKRRHKDLLLGMMGTFLAFQFLVTAILVIDSGFFIMLCHLIGKPFSDDTIKLIFTFIGAYITSVVIELIAILNYIVQKVFDTSIADLVAIFKDSQTKK